MHYNQHFKTTRPDGSIAVLKGPMVKKFRGNMVRLDDKMRKVEI